MKGSSGLIAPPPRHAPLCGASVVRCLGLLRPDTSTQHPDPPMIRGARGAARDDCLTILPYLWGCSGWRTCSDAAAVSRSQSAQGLSSDADLGRRPPWPLDSRMHFRDRPSAGLGLRRAEASWDSIRI